MTPQKTAYFLVAHGSRSPKPQQSLNQLAHFFETRLQAKQHHRVWVGTGCLEFQDHPLADQLLHFAQTLPGGIQTICVLPVFLLPGNHVRGDIPEEIQDAQAKLQAEALPVKIELTPHIGSHPGMKDLLQSKMEEFQVDQWILIGHGSKREAGNQSIRQLAKTIKAEAAFWAVQPSLEDVIENLSQENTQMIGVLPFFLFSGKITAAIADKAMAAAEIHPELTIHCASPLEPSEALADLLIELSETAGDLTTEWRTYANA